MLVFAAAGVIDKIAGNRLRLSEPFDRGLLTMGTMCIPMVGTSCAGVALMQNNMEAITAVMEKLPFDPSMLVGVLLAPDMGGYFIAEQLSQSREMLMFNGVVIGALLGQMVTFQLPIFLAAIRAEDRRAVMNGFVIGLIAVPAGFIAAALLLGVDLKMFIAEFIPVFALCLLMAIGLIKAPVGTVRGFEAFAQGVQIVIVLLFAVTAAGVFIPSLAYADSGSVSEILVILFRSAIIISGALVLSEIVLKLFRKRIRKAAERFGMNEVSAVGLLLGCATSLAVVPLISRMDDKGKMINGAFSVSGAYFIGGQMGFVSSVTDGYTVAVMVAAKLICGCLSVFIAYRMYDRLMTGGEA